MYFLIYGSDTYRSRKALAAMRTRFAETRDVAGLNSLSFKAESYDAGVFAEALFSAPFLAERKMVVAEGFLSELVEDVQAGIAEILSHIGDDVNLIFFEPCGQGDLAGSPLFLPLLAQKYTVCYEPPKGPALLAFLAAEAAEAGTTIAPRAAQALVAAAGEDTWQLHTEVAKLASFVLGKGRKEILEEDVREIASVAKVEDVMFAFIDAVGGANPSRAVALLEILRSGDVADAQVVAMLLRHFRTLAAARDCIDRGDRDVAGLAKKLGINAFSAEKAFAAAQRFRSAAPRTRYDELLKIDVAIKTSSGDPGAMLQLFAMGTGV